MTTSDILWLGWPYVGAGAGIAITLYLLFSKSLQTDEKYSSRFFNVQWLSWAMAAAYLLHVLEEYGLHIADGQFQLITSFKAMGIDEMFGGLSLGFFPMVNILITWITLPIAACISKKNPVIGLSGIGFVLVNAMTHVGAGAARGMSLAENFGVFTGVLLFIPLTIWTIIANRKAKLLPKKGIDIALISGILEHILLFGLYIINKFAGNTVAYIFIPVVAFSAIIISWALCRVFKISFEG